MNRQLKNKFVINRMNQSDSTRMELTVKSSIHIWSPTNPGKTDSFHSGKQAVYESHTYLQ